MHVTKIVTVHIESGKSPSFVHGTVEAPTPAGYEVCSIVKITSHDYHILDLSACIENNTLYASGYYASGYASSDISFKILYIKSQS